MIKPKTITISPIAADADDISVAQTTVGAGNLTITGDLASGGVATLPNGGHTIDIASTGNLFGVTFTVYGADPNGTSTSEAIAGPNNGTVTTTGFFKTVTRVAVDGAVGTNVTVGHGNSLLSQIIPLDIYENVTSIAVSVTGTINYSVQKSDDRPTQANRLETAVAPTWFDGGLTGLTVNANTQYNSPVGAVRLMINSYSDTATAAIRYSQSNYGHS